MQYNLEEIAQRVSIEELAEEHGVSLEPAGADYIALCPFHDDVRTKSMRIYGVTNSWWCYGCQKGGSVFDFVMCVEGISFSDAVEKLALRCGLTDSFDLPDLNVRASYSLQQFRELRENVEQRITAELKNFYFAQKKISIFSNWPVYLNMINDLWKWYDNGQRYFDGHLLKRKQALYSNKSGQQTGVPEEVFFQFLTEKTHSFYLKFVEKFNRVREGK